MHILQFLQTKDHERHTHIQKMDAEYRRLADIILHQARVHHNPRYIVAIAGVPGSGKTTTASAVVNYLNQNSTIHASLLSMDGFHLSRHELDQLPNAKEAHIRRGAPWTFDVSRFVNFMQTLRDWADNTPLSQDASWDSSHILTAPTFDHNVKDPVQDGISITPDSSIIIVEGNYLLLDEPGWRDLSRLCDYRVFVDTDLSEARDRTAKRHVKAGIEKTLEEGYRRVDSNDYLNGVSIQEKLIIPDLIIKSVPVNGQT